MVGFTIATLITYFNFTLIVLLIVCIFESVYYEGMEN